MKDVVKRIWTLYAILTITSVIFFFYLVNSSWESLRQESRQHQHGSIELFSHSMDTLLKAQEVFLNITSKQTISPKFPSDANKEEVLEALHSLLKVNHSIAALGIILPNGEVYAFTSLSNRKSDTTEHLINLKEFPSSSDSFIQALNSYDMVLGHTYYLDVLDDLIIPVRKAIRNQDGAVVAVITAGIRLHSSTPFENNTPSDNQVIGIVRNDYYWQYHSQFANVHDKQVANRLFHERMPQDYHQQFFQSLLDTQNLSFEQITSSDEIFTFDMNTDFESTQVLAKYDRHFHHWYISYIEISKIRQIFIPYFKNYIFIFLLIHLVIFGLFYQIFRTQRASERALLKQVSQDALTGIPNRKYLRDSFTYWTKEYSQFSFLYLDLDHFKKVNDNYGHEAGDQILIEMVRRINDLKGDDDTLVREAGDEFIIHTPNYKKSYTNELSQKIIDQLSLPFILGEHSITLGCSIGIAKYPEHGESLEEVISCADKTMYRAKKYHNTFLYYVYDADEKSDLGFLIEQKLHQAIHNDLFFLKYQPQLDAQKQLVSVEVLLRWNDSDLGFISPEHFIEVAEHSNTITSLSKYLFDKLCCEIIQHPTVLKEMSLSINISTKHFMSDSFIHDITPLLEQCQRLSIHLTIEITESVFISDKNLAKERISQLKKLGIKLSLDDFGTGYSSLSMLKDLPIDEIKIDSSFITTIDKDEIARTMAENIIAIGKGLKKFTVAEGIENQEQWDILKLNGCSLFQGNFLSSPLSIEDLHNYILKHSLKKSNIYTI